MVTEEEAGAEANRSCDDEEGEGDDPHVAEKKQSAHELCTIEQFYPRKTCPYTLLCSINYLSLKHNSFANLLFYTARVNIYMDFCMSQYFIQLYPFVQHYHLYLSL